MANTPPVDWVRGAKLAAVLLGLLGLIYAPSFDNDFVLDDDVVITQNTNVTQADGLYRTWFTTAQLDYWPISFTSFWLEWRAFGPSPNGYHVLSMLLQFINAWLVWLVLVRLKIPGAAFAAILFAVHPVCVESVAWAVQRKNTLSMVFFLLTILAYVRPPTRKTTLTALALFAAALLTKTSVVMLPVVLLACVWWQHGALTRRDLRRITPFFGLALGFGLLTLWFHSQRVVSWNLVRTDSPLSRLLGAGWVTWFYLHKALVPVGLRVVYPRWQIDPGSPMAYLPLAALLIGAAVLYLRRRSWGRAPWFALVYFVANLVPVMGFATVYFMKLSFVADHWQYFSLLGVIALVAGLGAVSMRRAGPLWATLGPVLAVLVVAGCVAQSRQHIKVFDGKERFGRAAVRGAPNNVAAWFMLGATLDKRGAATEAATCYARGLAASERQLPRAAFEPHLYAEHGFLLLSAGRKADAERFLRKGIAAMPSNGKAYFHLGKLLEERGDAAGALALFQAGVAAQPNVDEARFKLGITLAMMNRTDEAIDQYRVGLRLNERDAHAHATIAVLLAMKGRTGAAIHHYERALALDPGLPPETRERLRRLKAGAPSAP